MMEIGYSLLGEQAGPKQLVADATLAEEAGFDFAAVSDRYSPRLRAQGHSPYAWSVLGAVAQVTERLDLMSLVTCPIRRYHPAVVAQKAATLAVLSDGRFTLGVGAGENLNEHVVGAWPHVTQRHDMLVEALEIINALLAGESLSYRGDHFEVPQASLRDLPAEGVPVAVAVSGRSSIEIAGRFADALVSVTPDPRIGPMFDAAGGAGKPRYGRLAVCYGADAERCRRMVHEQWRWGLLDWPVLAELPDPAALHGATRHVRPADVADRVPCGPDLDLHVRAARQYADAGFTHLALVQVGGGTQREFLEWAGEELLPALAEL
jgi:G6PDH family F420-dependent oxidoreductase